MNCRVFKLHWMSDGEFSIMFYNIISKIFKYIIIIVIVVFGFSLAFMVQHDCLSFPPNTTVRSLLILRTKYSTTSFRRFSQPRKEVS